MAVRISKQCEEEEEEAGGEPSVAASAAAAAAAAAAEEADRDVLTARISESGISL